MAHIVDIRVHALKGTARAAQRRGFGSAEIVIFPGVRYERRDEPARGKGLGHKRDLIDLPE